MGWKPEVFVSGKWCSNALVFATEKEASESAYDLMMRWILVMESRAIQTDEAPKHSYHDRVLAELPHVRKQRMVADYVSEGLGENQ